MTLKHPASHQKTFSLFSSYILSTYNICINVISIHTISECYSVNTFACFYRVLLLTIPNSHNCSSVVLWPCLFNHFSQCQHWSHVQVASVIVNTIPLNTFAVSCSGWCSLQAEGWAVEGCVVRKTNVLWIQKNGEFTSQPPYYLWQPWTSCLLSQNPTFLI